MTRTTGCNKPGPTTSRSAAPDIGGSPGNSKPRSKRRSASRREPAQPGDEVTSRVSSTLLWRRRGSVRSLSDGDIVEVIFRVNIVRTRTAGCDAAADHARAPGAVHGVTRLFPQQDAPDFLGGLGAQLVVAFDAVKSGVGRQQNIGMLAQPLVFERLGLDDVEARRGDLARIESCRSARSSTSGPRAVLMSTAPGRIRAIVRALIMCRFVASR